MARTARRADAALRRSVRFPDRDLVHPDGTRGHPVRRDRQAQRGGDTQLQSSETKAAIAKLGLETRPLSPEQLAKLNLGDDD